MQEKGNIDLAIRYYLIAIEVCIHVKADFIYLYVSLTLTQTSVSLGVHHL